MQIIDGYCNEPNIFADDIGEYNTAIWGTRDCVLPAGERLGYELVSNNEIKIKDGVFSTQGRRGVIKKGTTESCIIENGTQAENRNDLIVIEYVKDSSTLAESHTLKVLKGTPGETAVDPDVVTGDIQAGDVLHQMPLYRVKLEGLNVVAVERLFSVGNNAIGKEFDPDKDYEIGDLTLQNNKAWKFKVKHLAGAWDESQMEETDILTELSEQNKNFGGVSFGIDGDGNYGYYGADGSLIPFSGKKWLFLKPTECVTAGTTNFYKQLNFDLSSYDDISSLDDICMYTDMFGSSDAKNAEIPVSYAFDNSTKIFSIENDGSNSKQLWQKFMSNHIFRFAVHGKSIELPTKYVEANHATVDLTSIDGYDKIDTQNIALSLSWFRQFYGHAYPATISHIYDSTSGLLHIYAVSFSDADDKFKVSSTSSIDGSLTRIMYFK